MIRCARYKYYPTTTIKQNETLHCASGHVWGWAGVLVGVGAGEWAFVGASWWAWAGGHVCVRDVGVGGCRSGSVCVCVQLKAKTFFVYYLSK